MNQRHHRALQPRSLNFEFLRRCRLGYAMRLAEYDLNLGKGTGQNEAVPAFKPPAARIFHVDGDDRGASLLRQENDTLAKLVGWTTWTIGCYDDVTTAGEDVLELKQRRRAHS